MSLNNRRNLELAATQLARDLRAKSTETERILWEALRSRRLDGLKFYRQKPIYHDITGRESYFIADFFCFSARLVIEIDGDVHEMRKEEDLERTRILGLLGLRELRYTNRQIKEELATVLATIAEACRPTLHVP